MISAFGDDLVLMKRRGNGFDMPCRSKGHVHNGFPPRPPVEATSEQMFRFWKVMEYRCCLRDTIHGWQSDEETVGRRLG